MKRLIPLWCVALLLFLPLLGNSGNASLLAAEEHAQNVHVEHAGEGGDHQQVDTHAQEHEQAHGSLHDGETHELPLGQRLPLWSVIPFVGILLSIAVIPLAKPHFYHHNFGKVAAFWALLFAVPFWIAYGTHTALHAILHIYVVDYIPFIILLFGLFTVAGGIAVKGKLAGTPIVNTGILLIGTLLSSWIGTTGSAMLLIRPLLKSNEKRRYRVHSVIFFIFLVANIGGSLTPIGDPPLFLGFLHGVKFFWTLRCFMPMLVNVVVLLVVFFIIDTVLMKKEQISDEGEKDPLRLEGGINFLMLLGIVGAVIFSGSFNHHPAFYDQAHHAAKGITLMGGAHPLVLPYINLVRDLFILLMAWVSLKLTAKATREANEFNWFPIQEVAYVFAGIFMTIIPALEILRAGTEGALGFIVERVSDTASYFWVTGALSSFLDNAPTYLTFFNTALGQQFPGMAEAQAVPLLMEGATTLLAISCGAVFMGANTYIGNAPNFMVKSIAEQRGVKMPSFFGYMLWSVGILIPVFILDTLIFF